MSKAQIFPQPNPHAFCQVHNCRNVAKHHIGKPGSGSLLRLTYIVCDDCLRDIIASAPAEFLPQPEDVKPEPVTPIDALTTVKTMADSGTITKEMFLEALMPLLSLWADEEDGQDSPAVGANGAQPGSQAALDAQEKGYACKFCGEKADSPPKLATHVRFCPMNPKNGGGTSENGGKPKES